ncbi:enoyl-CoA hydratase/isomerase family protein, partial [Corynebacterium coyleae]
DDDTVAQVVIQSSAKHFCSGGDVRAAREGVLEGRLEEVDAFFADEYAMNLDIANYPKPYIALCSGVIMG